MGEPILSASVVALCDVDRFLWAQRPRSAPVLGAFHVFPGGRVEATDRDAPNDGGDVVGVRVAALRELFEEVGVLRVDGELEPDEEESLRETFQHDPEQGHRRLRELGLNWRTSELIPIGRWVTPSYADFRFDTFFFALKAEKPYALLPDPFEIETAEWVSANEALARWERSEVMIAPPLAVLIRTLAAGQGFEPGALSRVYGAQGEESLRWEYLPWIQLMQFRTPTLPPATHTNSFLVGSGEMVVVEPATPYKDEQDRFLRWVEEARSGGRKLLAVIATHHHPDHFCLELVQRLGLPLWVHEATDARIEGVQAARHLQDGERITLAGSQPVNLSVIHTPGHAPGHLCLLEERTRAVLCGDMVAGTGTILIEPKDGDMGLYLESLERLRRLEPSVLIPAHGPPLRDPQAVLTHYIDHRLAREAKVLEALQQIEGEALTPDLLPVAYADVPQLLWPLATLSTEAHLLKLHKEGRVERTAEGWRALPSD